MRRNKSVFFLLCLGVAFLGVWVLNEVVEHSFDAEDPEDDGDFGDGISEVDIERIEHPE